jgi:hypothetical protein
MEPLRICPMTLLEHHIFMLDNDEILQYTYTIT